MLLDFLQSRIDYERCHGMSGVLSSFASWNAGCVHLFHVTRGKERELDVQLLQLHGMRSVHLTTGGRRFGAGSRTDSGNDGRHWGRPAY
jgi:hypothetical protein